MPKGSNLTSKYGFGANPQNIYKGGRPKMPDLNKELREVFAELDADTKHTALRKILDAQYKLALKGNTKAAQFLIERGYGKAVDHIDITSGGEKININPLVFVGDSQ